MKTKANKYGPEIRAEFLRRVDRGETIYAVGKALGVPDTTARKWHARRDKYPGETRREPVPGDDGTSRPVPLAGDSTARPETLTAALRGAGNAAQSGTASPGLQQGQQQSRWTGRAILGLCEIVTFNGLKLFCTIKKIPMTAEMRKDLAYAPEEREMLLALADDAAPAWSAAMEANKQNAIYFFLGAVGISAVTRIFAINTVAKDLARDREEREHERERAFAPKSGPVGPIPNSPIQRGNNPAEHGGNRNPLVPGNSAEREDATGNMAPGGPSEEG